MKIVLKEWWKDKTACCMMLGWLLISSIYDVLQARLVIMISTTMSDLPNWQHNLTAILAVSVVGMFLSMAMGWLRPMGIHHCFRTLNNHYADKVLDSDASMFTEFSCAYINSMAEYIWRITEVGRNTTRLISNIVQLSVTLISIYLVGGRVIIPVLIIHTIGFFLCKYLFKRYTIIDDKADKIKQKRNQEIENIVNGFAEVRSFGTQEWHRASIRKLNDDIYDGRKERSHVQMATSFSFDLVESAGLLAIMLYSIQALGDGILQPAAAMSLVMYVFRLCNPIGNIVDYFDSLSQDTARASSYAKIIHYKDPIPDGTITLDSFNEGIELKDISFAYDNSSQVLNHVSMKFQKGQKIGICGTTGVGKTTLFKLLNRFYKEKSGEILIDGINIHDITRKSYFKHVCSVHQDNTIFPCTIRENILYGNPHVTEYEMITACKQAKIFDFIQSLPDRFETVVGPRGLTLSGGQKQRIALARLFLRNPDIILLDEATSALDNQSETFIQEAIDALPDKTIITIAHRLSTIRNSDIIYVMGPHGIAESGTHEELMARKGIYYAMNK